MSHAHRESLGDRIALLAARAELDRTKVSLAIFEVRSIVAPEPAQLLKARVRPTAAMIMGLAAPMLGATRITRLLRFTTIALMALRIARNWK